MISVSVIAALARHRCSASGPGQRPRLLTYEQASRELGVSRSTLYKLLREGTIRAVELAPQVRRIEAVEIDRYIAACPARGLGTSGSAHSLCPIRVPNGPGTEVHGPRALDQ